MPKSKQRQRWYIRRIRLNAQGYAAHGEYYGTGRSPLWFAHSADGELDFIIRGSRSYAVCAYQWVRITSDPEWACRFMQNYHNEPMVMWALGQ
jgi:hypothetical protein